MKTMAREQDSTPPLGAPSPDTPVEGKPAFGRSENPALPRTIAWLGYGGLLPFVLLATASLLDHRHAAFWTNLLYAYGAIILSFIGALHWGMAMLLPELGEAQRSAWLVWSVVPALLAWPAVLAPPATAAALLVAGFFAHYLQDRRLVRQARLPAWYLPLRLRLSLVAVTCLIAASFAIAIEPA